jgi:hypothetical protein
LLRYCPLHGRSIHPPEAFLGHTIVEETTNVLIERYTGTEFLETNATVARFEPKHGMGLTFEEISPHFAERVE